MYYFTFFLIGFQILTLHFFGQPFFCECGYISLWSGDIFSSENSQQFLDWYTFSHIIHGVLFYYLLRYLFPRSRLSVLLLIALSIEIGWELLENTPAVIEHYREQALATGYAGDSILNSVSDSLAMVAGFFFTSLRRAWEVVVLVILFELGTLYMIRDNLTPNIWNLTLPSETVQEWQSELRDS